MARLLGVSAGPSYGGPHRGPIDFLGGAERGRERTVGTEVGQPFASESGRAARALAGPNDCGSTRFRG
eukprot:6805759-Alexandrium_andersonii.AAC.1